MSDSLLVPIHLDALCLDTEQSALREMADYSKLPYIFDEDTYNGGNKNLSEQILAPLFNQEFTLKAGVHLHWALPDALTNGRHDEDGTTFPHVPNRWLIVRTGGGKDEQQWIVESDYLYDPPTSSQSPLSVDATNILIEPPDLANVDPNNPETYQYHRNRYMGRSWSLAEWQADPTPKEYAPMLTAIGPQGTVPVFDEVKATFAAFYPNCHTVFGFHDPEFQTSTPPEGLQYEVIGWYEYESNDVLNKWTANNSEAEGEALLGLLQDEFRWTIEFEEGATVSIPPRTLYHARVTFAGGEWLAQQQGQELEKPEIAIGNSVGDALSAYLAHTFLAEANQDAQIDKNEILRTVEIQLAALQLSERIESRKLDLDAKLREARHEAGFSTKTDGFLWSIVPQISSGELEPTRITRFQNVLDSQEPQPDDLAKKLNKLNIIQEKYNQAWLDIESLRHRLYSQWYYFMKHPDEKTQFYNPLYFQVSEASLKPLRTAIADAGELLFVEADDQITIEAKNLPFGVVSILSGFFQDYVSGMAAGVAGQFLDDGNWRYIIEEFTNCNVEFSETRTVTTVVADQAWQIHDQGQTYDVKVEDGVFNIYVPPSASRSEPPSESPSESQIAFQLVAQINVVLAAIDKHNNRPDSIPCQLKQFPSQNYWRPNDPVVLLGGDATQPPHRFGQDGRLREDGYLECFPLAFDANTVVEQLETLQVLIEDLRSKDNEESVNFLTWDKQPWNPFAFHWMSEVYPARDMDGSNTIQPYTANQILKNYSLKENAIDLQLQAGKESQLAVANSYSGFSILTPAAGLELTQRLTDYLSQEVLPEYYGDLKITEENQTPDYLADNIQQIKSWYEGQYPLEGPLAQANDPKFMALWSYAQLQASPCQAQAIGGFNDALLLAPLTYHLAVDNPTTENLAEAQFHEQVRWTLGNARQFETLDGDIFNPIRSGAVSLRKLWMVDSYGRHQVVIPVDQPLKETKIVTTLDLTPDNETYHMRLSPRLAQPARLNFHWLAAEEKNEVEMTSAPARTPVCGWLVPNNLDSTLDIHDNQGKALGSIDRAGNWRTAPEVVLPLDENNYPDLPNYHLQKMVHYLLGQGTDFQQAFLTAVDCALETIDPENFAEHPSLALLIGRPIALVRATFSLEVQGLPASDPTVKIENAEDPPTTDGFTDVNVPIRLGDYQQLNDGLVGYWRETPTGGDDYDYDYEGNIFYVPQNNTIDNAPLIQTEGEGIINFEQTVHAAPQGVTMLIDPRGQVHATCGLLPNQELRLPPQTYNQALQKIGVNLISTPILSDIDQSQGLAIPLPQVPEHVWSWVSLVESAWSEKRDIRPVNTKATFSKQQKIYEGWLQLSKEEHTT